MNKIKKIFKQTICEHYYITATLTTQSEYYKSVVTYPPGVLWECIKCNKRIVKNGDWIPFQREIRK